MGTYTAAPDEKERENSCSVLLRIRKCVSALTHLKTKLETKILAKVVYWNMTQEAGTRKRGVTWKR